MISFKLSVCLAVLFRPGAVETDCQWGPGGLIEGHPELKAKVCNLLHSMNNIADSRYYLRIFFLILKVRLWVTAHSL